MKFNGRTFLIEGRDSLESWARAVKIVSSQPKIISGEDYQGNAKLTKDANLVIVLDEEAVDEIVEGKVHPAFNLGKQALVEYSKEFTYNYVKKSWKLPQIKKFTYTYMDRLINYPVPTVYIYQGDLLEFNIPEKYFTKIDGGLTGGFDQLKVAHDLIRSEGISRRHQLILWIPAIDMFSKNPPCLQRIWFRVLVPADDYFKYRSTGIPVEVAIEYRSWDLINGMPANLYAILNMLYRYVFGNINEDNEYKNGELNNYAKIDYKIEKLVLFGNAVHIYEDSFDIIWDV